MNGKTSTGWRAIPALLAALLLAAGGAAAQEKEKKEGKHPATEAESRYQAGGSPLAGVEMHQDVRRR
jgi:hypothetical protein